MTRLTMALAVWMSLVSGASASVALRKEAPALGTAAWQSRTSKLAAEVREQQTGRGAKSELVVTDQTEIRLNGKPCKYADIPDSAEHSFPNAEMIA
jgi:hypothetical protein